MLVLQKSIVWAERKRKNLESVDVYRRASDFLQEAYVSAFRYKTSGSSGTGGRKEEGCQGLLITFSTDTLDHMMILEVEEIPAVVRKSQGKKWGWRHTRSIKSRKGTCWLNWGRLL